MKKRLFIKPIFIGLILLYNSCQTSISQTHCEELDAIDLKMLQMHEKIKSKYAADKRFLQRLQDAQVYWIQYKDRHVRSLYPLEKKYYEEEYGKTYNQCKCKEAARLTYLRVEELKKWLDGTTDSDCPTSFK